MDKTPTRSSPGTRTSSSDAAASDACITYLHFGAEAERAASRAAHPAGKGDPLARRDIAPGRVLPDTLDQMNAVIANPPSLGRLDTVPEPDVFEIAVWEQTDGLAGVLLRKHHDYGPLNIALTPGGPLNGLRVRMHDKLARINHLLDLGVDPENESLRDSFLDLAGYAVIGLLVLDGEWPA